MDTRKGPVLIVDDDIENIDLLKEAWAELGYENDLLFLQNGEEVLDYLASTKPAPFLILCDVNMAKMDGFELKEKILSDSRMNYRSIPFIYWSDHVSKAQIQKAYDLGGNGFFIKDNTYLGIKQSLKEIVNYWSASKVPQ